MAVAPHYAEAFGQPRRAVHVAPRAPAHRPVRRPGAARRAPRPASARATACRTAAGSSSTRRRSAATRCGQRPLRRPAGPARRCTTSWATSTSSCSSCTRSCARRLEIPPDLAAFAIDASDRPRPQRADARRRRPRDRLLERDVRVRAARPADRVPRARRRRRTTRERGFYLDFRARPARGRSSTTTAELAAAIRGRRLRPRAGARVRARRASTSPTGARRARIVDQVLLPALDGRAGRRAVRPRRRRRPASADRRQVPAAAAIGRPPRSCASRAAGPEPAQPAPRPPARRRACRASMIPPTSRLTISPAWSKRRRASARSSVIAPICWTSPVSDVRSSAFVARLSASAAGHSLERPEPGARSLNLRGGSRERLRAEDVEVEVVGRARPRRRARSWITAPDSSMSVSLVVFSVAAGVARSS